MHLAPRVADLSLSVTLALDARAKELAAAGQDVVSMAVGEPDFPAPAAARRAATERIESGDVRYTPAAGTAGLRDAVARHLSATRGGPFEPRQVVVCHSAKQALSGSLLSLVQQGDEVVIPLPAWVSYFEQVRIAAGRPVLVPARADYRPDLEAVARAITPRTRGLMLCSPSNPTGYVLTREELEAYVELAVAHDLWILSDEIYRRLVYDDAEALSPVQVDPRARERTLIVDGASKAFAMTGYRIGFVAGPPDLAAAVTRLHSQTTGAPNTVSQAAYEACLRDEPPEVEEMRRTFAARRGRLVAGLRELGLALPEPRGAFYAFPDVSAYLDERGSAGFCEDLLEAERLVLVPGSAFGADAHVRLSYALDEARLDEALRRLARFLATRTAAQPGSQPARSKNQ